MALDVIPYHKMKVLVIEDLAEMRSSMKSMLSNMGIQDINTVNNGEDALKAINKEDYDIVLSDYELGRGKDGQQILEEVRYSKLIRASCVYILVTAAQTVEMVMGALEFEPDGYIVKPVTLDLLRTRLNRIVRTKDIYKEINKALDKRNIDGALDACNRLAIQKPKFALPAYRIKGRILLDEKRWEEAKDLYDTVLGIKRVAWAVLGMGKVHYHLDEFDDAKTLLEGLANTNSKYVEAQDWLAKVLEAQGKYKAAQKVLEAAVDESPKSCIRQQELGRVAELNGDPTVMRKACRKAISLGKNSVFARPEPFIGLAKSLQVTIKSGSMRDSKLATQEAMNNIETARSDFELSALQNLKCALVEAETLFNSKNEAEGQLAYKLALHLIDDSGSLTIDDQIDVFSSRLLFENATEIETAKQKLLDEIGENNRLQTKFFRVIENSLSNKPAERLDMMKGRARELMERDDIEDALELLLRAESLPGAEDETRLMLFHALVSRFEKGRAETSLLEKGDELAEVLGKIPQDNPMFPSIEKYQQRWQVVTNERQSSE
ncbi:MAG: response regulator [Pseudomonadales bacterium]|nr:response regulator [Pseudomonadales bacterium]